MKKFYSWLSWLITLILPLLLIMSVARILFTPLYLQYEYNKPNFPPDTFGFTLEERLYWGEISVDYLLNQAELEGQTLPDGSPLYNERELSHMEDVRVLVQQALLVWYVFIALLAGLALWAWRGGWLSNFWKGISRGGWLTTGLLLTILILVATSFDALFTEFHHLFFEGGTWQFLYSDTPIRLFPMKFWQDAFALIGGITLLASVLLGYFGSRWMRTSSE
ncbi:MAG: TIGR01906 family membrane protein [Anaerolineaceae bacterium]|nr:TIGR01906 family membrane protein [Anaerolineaceae bacterium]